MPFSYEESFANVQTFDAETYTCRRDPLAVFGALDLWLAIRRSVAPAAFCLPTGH